MELPLKPEWTSRLIETVQMDSVTCYCPLTEKDKEKIRQRTLEGLENYEEEDVHFWIGPPMSRPVFTTFVAYFKKYICRPDCCENNESTITMRIADAKNPKIKEKLNNGEQILKKIMNMDRIFFPDDKDSSFFGKLQFFYNTIVNCCVSCGDRFDSEECWCCATRRIQAEELFHAENTWYNTGQQNVYTIAEPFHSRDSKQDFCMGLITQRLDKKEWYSPERAAIRRFLGCSKRSKDRMSKLFMLCVNAVVERCDEERITHLPCPTRIKEQILRELNSAERRLTEHVRSQHIMWVFPTEETVCLRPRGCYFYTDGECGENGISC